ncbi:hypothetical protein BRC90_12145 [Halobacteriales archaeon QS_4_69_34]|nr:MAG: hypothetical protein BRC90_12145 [Halobacteriales archaeon QS_4_69_34]
MAGPLRFRRSTGCWDESRVRRDLLGPLDASLGASLRDPRFEPPPGYDARRLEMDNGDLALFCWDAAGRPADDPDDSGDDPSRGAGDDSEAKERDNGMTGGAFWLGNTETPEALWRTEKYGFGEVPYPISRWAQRGLLTGLDEETPWLTGYRHVAWFFLPVLYSKDGRHTTRAFFRDHAAGFPDATRQEGLSFYEEFLSTGILDAHRETMAGKLGTSATPDPVRMRAAMGEFDGAKLLAEAGYALEPEPELDSGHALDFRVAREPDVPPASGDVLVELTRPEPPGRRAAGSPTTAVRETVAAKTGGQLDAHPGALLLVDCTSFRDGEWAALCTTQPEIGYRPAVVFRARPAGSVEGYATGSIPLDLDDGIEWV